MGTLLGAAEASAQAQAGASTETSDEVILNDGSVIKGTLLFVEGDYLHFENDAFDPITIEVWDIRSIKTAGPVDVVVDTGERWRGKVSANAQGEMVFEPEEGGAARPLNFGFVDGIYQLRSVWGNDLTFGISRTAGNSDVLGVSLLGHGTRDTEKHRFTWLGQLTYARANGEEVEENWSGTAKYDYFFRPRLYLAGAEELRHDKFKDLRVRSVTSVSLGYVFRRKPEMHLEAEIGGGALVERFYEAEDINELALRGAVNYKMPIGRKTDIINIFVIYVSGGTDRAQLVNTFKFEVEFTRRWGLEIVSIINHDSDPSFFATDTSDFQWTIGLAYSF
jgi:putative salt-induced outer membrane protein YdiY